MHARLIPFVTKEVLKNAAMGIGPIRARRLRGHRTSASPDPSKLYRFAFMLPDLVLQHVGPVTGKDVLEIGPGDHLATGLTFIALGAKSYTALDRFPGDYSGQSAKAWYRLVHNRFFSHGWNAEWPSFLDPDTFPEEYPQVGTLPLSIEALGNPGKFDIVCSLAVGEHVSDVAAFAHANRELLRPSGRALHYVDFSGHVWEKDPKDPLMFRRIPDVLWSAMGSNRGYPNRIPFERFSASLADAGLDVKLASTKPFAHNPAIQEAVYVLSRSTR